jgi:hypothetical protein
MGYKKGLHIDASVNLVRHFTKKAPPKKAQKRPKKSPIFSHTKKSTPNPMLRVLKHTSSHSKQTSPVIYGLVHRFYFITLESFRKLSPSVIQE